MEPVPDYLLAAEQLTIEPWLCVFVEDSEAGVASAKAAGMLCIGFHNRMNHEHDISQADVEIDALKIPKVISQL